MLKRCAELKKQVNGKSAASPQASTQWVGVSPDLGAAAPPCDKAGSEPAGSWTGETPQDEDISGLVIPISIWASP